MVLLREHVWKLISSYLHDQIIKIHPGGGGSINIPRRLRLFGGLALYVCKYLFMFNFYFPQFRINVNPEVVRPHNAGLPSFSYTIKTCLNELIAIIRNDNLVPQIGNFRHTWDNLCIDMIQVRKDWLIANITIFRTCTEKYEN